MAADLFAVTLKIPSVDAPAARLSKLKDEVLMVKSLHADSMTDKTENVSACPKLDMVILISAVSPGSGMPLPFPTPEQSIKDHRWKI